MQIHRVAPDLTKRKEEWMKFDLVVGVLNSFNEVWCNIQLAVTKTRFFAWYVATKYDTARYKNSIFGVDSTSYPIALMLHDCITYDINMTLLWWMGLAKSRYQFISSFLGLLNKVTPWFVSNIDNTGIWI